MIQGVDLIWLNPASAAENLILLRCAGACWAQGACLSGLIFSSFSPLSCFRWKWDSPDTREGMKALGGRGGRDPGAAGVRVSEMAVRPCCIPQRPAQVQIRVGICTFRLNNRSFWCNPGKGIWAGAWRRAGLSLVGNRPEGRGTESLPLGLLWLLVRGSSGSSRF